MKILYVNPLTDVVIKCSVCARDLCGIPIMYSQKSTRNILCGLFHS